MRRGFTILETLLSGLLISIIFFVLFSLFSASLVMQRRSHDQVAAGSLAQSTMEQLRSTPFQNLSPGDQNVTPAPVVDGVTFQVHTHVAIQSPNVKTIAVNVTWQTGGLQTTSALTYDTHVFHYVNP